MGLSFHFNGFLIKISFNSTTVTGFFYLQVNVKNLVQRTYRFQTVPCNLHVYELRSLILTCLYLILTCSSSGGVSFINILNAICTRKFGLLNITRQTPLFTFRFVGLLGLTLPVLSSNYKYGNEAVFSRNRTKTKGKQTAVSRLLFPHRLYIFHSVSKLYTKGI